MYIHQIRDDAVMTVGAVTPYQYATSYNYDATSQYKFFGTTVSNERLQQLMQQYGIMQTGDSQIDLDALFQAMYPNAVSDVTSAAQSSQAPQKTEGPEKNTKTQEAAATEVPWANLMGQVGLVATGDLATDYEAFNTKLTAMQLSATTPEQKATIGLLQAESTIVFVAPSDSSTAATAASSSSEKQQPQAQSQPNISGADIQAQLNKILLGF